MSVRLSCPSCNTGFALDAIPADRRAACPRCGDVFPIRGLDAEGTGDRRQETEDREQRTEDRQTPVPIPKPERRVVDSAHGGDCAGTGVTRSGNRVGRSLRAWVEEA